MPDQPSLWIDQNTWEITGPGRFLRYTTHQLQTLQALLACPVCGGAAAALGTPTPDLEGGQLEYILNGRWECIYHGCQSRHQPPNRRIMHRSGG